MSDELTTRRGNKMAVIEQQLAALDGIFEVTSKLSRIGFELPTSPPTAEWPKLFARATEMISTGAIAGMAQALAVAARPADLTEVARCLAIHTRGYPTIQRSELDGFAELLTSDVFELGASAYAIVTACKKLRRTSRFLPSISETLAAIEEEAGRIHCGRYTVEKFGNYLERAVQVAEAKHVATPEGLVQVTQALARFNAEISRRRDDAETSRPRSKKRRSPAN